VFRGPISEPSFRHVLDQLEKAGVRLASPLNENLHRATHLLVEEKR
jgi:hypothetical protein